MTLTQKKCVPCEGGVDPLKDGEIKKFSNQTPEWNVVDNHHLSRSFEFKNFVDALKFVNEVGEVAEDEQHHPEITLGWGHADIKVWTHAIDGLHENDFILAAKIGALQ